jgi:hypothetical protein
LKGKEHLASHFGVDTVRGNAVDDHAEGPAGWSGRCAGDGGRWC